MSASVETEKVGVAGEELSSMLAELRDTVCEMSLRIERTGAALIAQTHKTRTGTKVFR